jgi:hypothetical protein
MIRNSSRFLLYSVLGALVAFAILVAAEHLGIWKKDWRAEHTIVEHPSFNSTAQFISAPRYPSPLVKIVLESLKNGPKISTKNLIDSYPALDKAELSVYNLRAQPTNFIGAITVPIFVNKLSQTKDIYLPCPSEQAIYWTECYGIYDFPWGETYAGLWRQDKLNGVGELTKENGDRYLGLFSNNQYNGCGILVKTDGTIQSGIWQYGQLVEKTNLCNAAATD